MKSLISSFSAPSVLRSLLIVLLMLNLPWLSTLPTPVTAPLLKSAPVMPVPERDQYSFMPVCTFFVVTVALRTCPSLRTAASGTTA